MFTQSVAGRLYYLQSDRVRAVCLEARAKSHRSQQVRVGCASSHGHGAGNGVALACRVCGAPIEPQNPSPVKSLKTAESPQRVFH